MRFTDLASSAASEGRDLLRLRCHSWVAQESAASQRGCFTARGAAEAGAPQNRRRRCEQAIWTRPATGLLLPSAAQAQARQGLLGRAAPTTRLSSLSPAGSTASRPAVSTRRTRAARWLRRPVPIFISASSCMTCAHDDSLAPAQHVATRRFDELAPQPGERAAYQSQRST